jgi:hypothetical protein
MAARSRLRMPPGGDDAPPEVIRRRWARPLDVGDAKGGVSGDGDDAIDPSPLYFLTSSLKLSRTEFIVTIVTFSLEYPCRTARTLRLG